jgi:hypothetical protein
MMEKEDLIALMASIIYDPTARDVVDTVADAKALYVEAWRERWETDFLLLCERTGGSQTPAEILGEK